MEIDMTFVLFLCGLVSEVSEVSFEVAFAPPFLVALVASLSVGKTHPPQARHHVKIQNPNDTTKRHHQWNRGTFGMELWERVR